MTKCYNFMNNIMNVLVNDKSQFTVLHDINVVKILSTTVFPHKLTALVVIQCNMINVNFALKQIDLLPVCSLFPLELVQKFHRYQLCELRKTRIPFSVCLGPSSCVLTSHFSSRCLRFYQKLNPPRR